MSNDSHLVPVLVQQIIENYNKPKISQQEKFQLEARLRAIHKAISNTIKIDSKDNVFK